MRKDDESHLSKSAICQSLNAKFQLMQAINYLSDYRSLPVQKSRITVFTRFMDWTKNEEKNRIGWVGISITAVAAIFFPITMSVVLINGAIISLIMGAMISMVAVVITNLAAMPTKYTIPALMLGILVDIVLIAISFMLR